MSLAETLENYGKTLDQLVPCNDGGAMIVAVPVGCAGGMSAAMKEAAALLGSNGTGEVHAKETASRFDVYKDGMPEKKEKPAARKVKKK